MIELSTARSGVTAQQLATHINESSYSQLSGISTKDAYKLLEKVKNSRIPGFYLEVIPRSFHGILTEYRLVILED